MIDADCDPDDRPDRLVIYVDAAGEHRWRALAPNGRIIADSAEGYSSHGHAVRAARQLIAADLVIDDRTDTP